MGRCHRSAWGSFPEYLVFEIFRRHATVERDGFRLRVDRRIPRVNRRYLFHKYPRYERDEVALLEAILERGDRVLELGAGFGIVSLHITRIVSDQGFLVAIEANREAFGILAENLALNARGFLCLEGLAALENGRGAFFVNRRNFHRSSQHDHTAPAGQWQQVEVARLSVPDLVDQHDMNALVMDIEGGEHEILGGWDLAGIDKLACEFHPSVYGKQTMLRQITALEERGFSKVETRGECVAFRRQRQGT